MKKEEEQLSISLHVINGEKYISLRELDRILLWDLSDITPTSRIKAYLQELRKRIAKL